MKKLISFITAIIMLVVVAVRVSAANVAEYEFGEIANLSLGDVDADTQVTSNDLAALRRILLSVDKVISNVSDMNYDGNVDIIDLVRLKKKLAGIEPTSIFNQQANALKNTVLSAEDTLPDTITGKTYYVSSKGSGKLANGSKSLPYSYDQLKSLNLSSGDAVLLKRGETYRGTIRITKDNIYIGAYGDGDKPLIYGSNMNYAEAQWTDEGKNIYSLSGFSRDVGFIALNDAESIGYKRSSLEEVTSDLDYWYDAENGKLYLYSSKAPNTYESIEIGVSIEHIRIVASNITVDNLALKYTGGHGISVGNGYSDITVKNCDIAFVGGSYLGSTTTRYGNGIELWEECKNVLIENNWIHDIYDSGITHQGGGGYTAENITVRSNLIERCGMGSIEYWLAWSDTDKDGEYEGKSKCVNVTYTENIMRYAGYGFGGDQRPDKVSSHIRSDVTCPNLSVNFKVTDNIFDISTGDLLEIGGTLGPCPILSGNTYAQLPDGKLGVYEINNNAANITSHDFGLFVKDTINYSFGDNTAKVCYY